MNVRTLGFVAALALCAPLFAAPPQAGGARPTARPAASAQTVNVNAADAAALAEALVGVGPAKAEAIVAYRKAHGAFKSADQLTDVPGISARTVERNRGRMVFR